MRVRHSKTSTSPIDEDDTTVSTSTPTEDNWKCASCGAMNENFRQFCDGCGDPRPGAHIPSGTGVSMDDLLASNPAPSGNMDEDSSSLDEPNVSGQDKPFDEEQEENDGEHSATFEDMAKPTPPPKQGITPPAPTAARKTEGVSKRKGRSTRTKQPETVLTGTFKQPTQPEPITTSTPSFPTSSDSIASDTTSDSSSRASTGQHFALIFVNSPASSLIKSRVSLEFEDFPTITLGRSPENVVVVPDQEVSRKHAQLSLEADRVILKDLNSSNGTFIYNGTEFQRVSDGVEVKPNSIIKFGTGTIVRLVSE